MIAAMVRLRRHPPAGARRGLEAVEEPLQFLRAMLAAICGLFRIGYAVPDISEIVSAGTEGLSGYLRNASNDPRGPSTTTCRRLRACGSESQPSPALATTSRAGSVPSRGGEAAAIEGRHAGADGASARVSLHHVLGRWVLAAILVGL